MSNVNQEWTSVGTDMPPHGVNVLTFYKNKHNQPCIVVGYYLERWKEESGFNDNLNYEYSKELDNYYIKEGWYEQQKNWGDYSPVFIHEGQVSHWMPLPPVPTFDDSHYRRGDIDDIHTLRTALWLARQAMAAHNVPDAGARSAVDAALLATGGLEVDETEDSLRRALRQVIAGEVYPVSELWNGIDEEPNE